MKKILLVIKKYWHTVLLLFAVIFFELWREEHKISRLAGLNKKIGKYKAKIKETDIELEKLAKKKEKNKSEVKRIKSMDKSALIRDIKHRIK